MKATEICECKAETTRGSILDEIEDILYSLYPSNASLKAICEVAIYPPKGSPDFEARFVSDLMAGAEIVVEKQQALLSRIEDCVAALKEKEK